MIKQKLISVVTLFSTLVVLLTLVFPALPVHATTASLSLTPGTQSMTVGQTYTINIHVNAQDPVNAVDIDLTYNPNDFSISLDGSTSSFPTVAQESASNGVINIDRGSLTPRTGLHIVSRLSVKALRANPRSVIAFAGTSAVVRASDNTNIVSTMTNGTYSISAPPVTATPTPAPAPQQPAAPPAVPSRTTPSAPTPNPNPTQEATIAPQDSEPTKNIAITDVKVVSERRKASITWSTSIPSTNTFAFGTNKKQPKTVQATQPSDTSYAVTIDDPLLIPGQTYWFTITSTHNEQVKTYEGEFTLGGFKIAITFIGSDGKPLKLTEVTMSGQTQITDEKGVATFTNLMPGTTTVTINDNGLVLSQQVTVIDNDEALQQAELVVDVQKNTNYAALFTIALVVLFAALIVAGIKLHVVQKVRNGISSNVHKHTVLPAIKLDEPTILPETPNDFTPALVDPTLTIEEIEAKYSIKSTLVVPSQTYTPKSTTYDQRSFNTKRPTNARA